MRGRGFALHKLHGKLSVPAKFTVGRWCQSFLGTSMNYVALFLKRFHHGNSKQFKASTTRARKKSQEISKHLGDLTSECLQENFEIESGVKALLHNLSSTPQWVSVKNKSDIVEIANSNNHVNPSQEVCLFAFPIPRHTKTAKGATQSWANPTYANTNSAAWNCKHCIVQSKLWTSFHQLAINQLS